MNTVNLIGNICNDIELRQTTSGKSVVQVNLAVKRAYAKDTTDFIPCVIWNQTAEFIAKYGRKGSKIAVTGKITSRNYEDKHGNKKVAYEVICDSAEFCEAKREATQDSTPAYAAPVGDVPNFEELESDEDLPF